MNLVYNTCNIMLRGVLKTFAHWTVEGRENVPPMGPLLVVANHQSNMDPPLLTASIANRRLYFLAKEGIFINPIVRAFLRSFGAFPLKRTGTDVQSFRWLTRKLASDQAVVIFPEGTRRPGSMRESAPGVALLALRCEVPILPVGITGTERMSPLWRVAFPTGDIKVRIGQVFSLPVIEGKVRRPQLEELTRMIMQRVAALLPESYRGLYSLKGNGASREGDGPSATDDAQAREK